MSLLEESLFSDSEASVSPACEAGSGPAIRSLRAPREIVFCLRAGGGLCVLGDLCERMCSCLRAGGSLRVLRDLCVKIVFCVLPPGGRGPLRLFCLLPSRSSCLK